MIIGLLIIYSLFSTMLNLTYTLKIVTDIRTKRALETYGDDEINLHAKGLKRNKRNKKFVKSALKLINGDKK